MGYVTSIIWKLISNFVLGSMFYVDDALNAVTADEYGIVMGTSHTEPMARATNEQSKFLNGTWGWSVNRANVTEFMRQGVERAMPYETLYTMGMRGLGDVESPTLNSSSLEQIVNVQQGLLREVYNTTNLSSIPQMWCLYKEVGGYFADGLDVPDDVTLLWSDDNWADMQRLPLKNETSRSGGAGIVSPHSERDRDRIIMLTRFHSTITQTTLATRGTTNGLTRFLSRSTGASCNRLMTGKLAKSGSSTSAI